MNISTTDIHGIFIIEPRVFGDRRGYFFESFSKRDFEKATGLSVNFLQDNESKSTRGVVRGLHFQRPPYSQAKLVRCVEGCVLDVAVDLRKDSPTFGHHVAVELSAANHRQLFIPKGFAHGFSVLSDEAVFVYKCDEYYTPDADGGISLLDSTLGIDWKIDLDKAIISDKDMNHPLLSNFDSPF